MSAQRRAWLARQPLGKADAALWSPIAVATAQAEQALAVSLNTTDPSKLVHASAAQVATRVYAQDRYQDQTLQTLWAPQERREHLYQQAQSLRHRDPEAAAYAFAQLAALELPAVATADTTAGITAETATVGNATARPDGAGVSLPLAPPMASQPLDPARLYARLAKYYGWSDEQMRRMPFKRLLMYLREMDIQLQEEKAAYDAEVKKSQQGSAAQDDEVDDAWLALHAESFAARAIPWPAPPPDADEGG